MRLLSTVAAAVLMLAVSLNAAPPPRIKIPAGVKGDVSIIGGVGFPDLIFAGAKYRLANRSTLGVTAGYFQRGEERILSASADHYFHLTRRTRGRRSRRVRGGWYCRQSLTYVHNEKVAEQDGFAYIVIALGREFRVLSPYYASIDAGVGIHTYNNSGGFEPGIPAMFETGMPEQIIPAVRIQFSYKMGKNRR